MEKKKKNTKKKKEEIKEILFETSTIISKEEFKRYQKFYSNKFKSSLIPKLILIGLVILAIVLNYIKGNYGVMFSVIGFAIVYPILLTVTLNIQVNRMFESNKRIHLLEEKLMFYDKYLESKSLSNWSKVNYEDILMICETKSNFYIFINSNQAFIIIKNNLDNVDEFRSFIKEKGIYRRYR